jgi:hypothetical protein
MTCVRKSRVAFAGRSRSCPSPVACSLARSPQQEAVAFERAKAAAEEAKTQAAKQP